MAENLIIRRLALTLAYTVTGIAALAQKSDTIQDRLTRIIFGSRENLELNGTRITTRIDSLLHPELRIGGYVSTYYAHYDDSIEVNNFAQFPTLAPRNNMFSLNMALISMEYNSRRLRGNLALHYGDIPESSWPKVFNLIQEAHVGFAIVDHLWFDAGFFKTHIGLGSFQPRENITSSMSIPDYYDPYFLSGAKLTWVIDQKFSVMTGIFNGYNEYVENNRNKAIGVSANYNVNEHIALTYNFLTCDESSDLNPVKHQRYYNNFFATFIYPKFTIGVDMNFGLQEHTLLSDTNKTAEMHAATLVAKYNIVEKLSVYARGEYFSDPNRILTNGRDLGNFVQGFTAGFEVKPSRTASLNFEWRQLAADRSIFKRNGEFVHDRNELIACLDVWF